MKSYNGYVWRPSNGVLYLYDSADGDSFEYEHPAMNARKWMEYSGAKGMGSRAAAIQSQLVELSDCFYDTPIPNFRHPVTNAQITYEDMAKEILYSSDKAADTGDESRAAAVITSELYPDFKDVVIAGQNTEVTQIKTGILTGLFQQVNLDVLSGKWATMDDDIIWENNLPESSTPEPSFGTGSTITVTVPKSGGAVAITDRARQVINGFDPFASISARLQLKRAQNENALTADEIEINTGNTIAGVDFGLRAGVPPTSSTNPVDFLKTMQTTFDTLKAPWNLFISKGFIHTEYITNDIVNGATNPPPSFGTQNEQVGPFPLADGVRWARDNEISSSVNGWALNDIAIKGFRGPLIQYTVVNQDYETTKYVIKNHFKPKTVDPTLIYLVTGIAA